MLRRFLSLILSITCAISLLKAVDEDDSLIKKLSQINMQSFGWEDDNWGANTMRDYIEQHMRRRLSPTVKTSRDRGFKFFVELEKKKAFERSILLDTETTWQDLTLFCGQADKKAYIGNALSRTTTELGRISQFLLLAQPLNDVSKLTKRQAVIKTIAHNQDMFTKLEQLFAGAQLPETAFLSFFGYDPFHATTKQQCTIHLPPALERINKSPFCLLLKSLYGHAMRVSWLCGNMVAVYACAAYLKAHVKKESITPQLEDGVSVSVGGPVNPARWVWDYGPSRARIPITIGTGIFFALNIKPAFGWMNDCFLFEESLHIITNQLARFMEIARTAYETVCAFPELASFDEFQGLMTFFEQRIHESAELKEFCDLLTSDTFKEEPSEFSHKGRIVRAFLFMHDIKTELVDLVSAIGSLDAYLGFAKLVNEFDTKRVRFCFPTYVVADAPQVQLTDFWHPLLDEQRVVTNSITLGNEQRQNMIITGPNAGGKSTILKAIALAILMAQTVGIAPASSMALTPFNGIKTYLNIVDDIGAGNSLFMAEARQAQRIIDTVQTSSPGQFTFTCFDEVFNGTSPVEGSAAAYSVATHLSGYKNCMCLIATHFPVLARLERATDSFKNYKVSVAKEGASLRYPYRLEEGSSHQHVALDVLREQGFSGSLLTEAEKLVGDPSLLNQ